MLSYEGGKLKLNSAQFQVKLSARAELGNFGSEHMQMRTLSSTLPTAFH